MYALKMTRRVITAKVTPQIALTVEKDWMLVEKKPPLGFCLNAAPSQKDVQFRQNSFPLKFSQMARCNSFLWISPRNCQSFRDDRILNHFDFLMY